MIREGDSVRDFETKIQTRSGEFRFLLMTVETLKIQDEPCYLRLAYDITERKRAEEQLLEEAHHRALHDSLTGLPNRTLFLDRLGRSLERTKRNPNYLISVLFMDIDRLKHVNDTLGHLAGDQLLMETARRLESCLRLGDTVARLGGDEFAILLEDITDVSDALRVADRIIQDMIRPFTFGEKDVSITASIGISLSGKGYLQPNELLRDADEAMYRAKKKGGGHCEVFDSRIHAQAVARLQMETDLLVAIRRRKFEVHYQPIIYLESGSIKGFEALGRWHHPNRGIVSLGEFIPVAETTGLIVDIGRWIFLQACRQLTTWHRAFPNMPNLSLNLNLTAKELLQPDLPKQLEDILAESDLNPELLYLEITEDVLMQMPEESTKALAALKSLGVRILIDDFGTGHSSLNVMYQYPIDGLKIARSFISRMDSASEAAEVVRTMVLLARDFGMQVTAKGIETRHQLAQLRELRCPQGQGYLFARPADEGRMSDLLASGPQW
jgi:diguanylate cyclase (GGDEF)-like protein